MKQVSNKYFRYNIFLSGFNDLNPIPIKYSKYAMSLDKVFKNQSLESLHINLKNPKKLVIKSFDLSRIEGKNVENLYGFLK